MASKYRKKFELPEGFYDVLENYSREVLRDQPLDIVEFSFLYFKALEEVSTKTRPDPSLALLQPERKPAQQRFRIVTSIDDLCNSFRLFRAQSTSSTTRRKARTFLHRSTTHRCEWPTKPNKKAKKPHLTTTKMATVLSNKKITARRKVTDNTAKNKSTAMKACPRMATTSKTMDKKTEGKTTRSMGKMASTAKRKAISTSDNH